MLVQPIPYRDIMDFKPFELFARKDDEYNVIKCSSR